MNFWRISSLCFLALIAINVAALADDAPAKSPKPFWERVLDDGKTLESLKLIGCATLGAFMLYVLNRHNGKQPLSLFRALNINVGDTGKPTVILLDMITSSSLGAVVVSMITSPTTVTQAVTAGLGMTGILAAASK